MIWNSIPSYNQQPADLDLGQTSMNGANDTAGGLGPSSFGSPAGGFSNLLISGVQSYGGY